MKPGRFELGRLLATPGVLQVLEAHGADLLGLVTRHLSGDWGEACDAHDRRMNERALVDGSRIWSMYLLPAGPKVWIITEADRSYTTILLPEEY